MSVKMVEYQGKEIFRSHGIPVPAGRVAGTPEEAFEAAGALGGRVVVKAQVTAGGRGKAGFVRLAEDPEGARDAAEAMLGKIHGGLPVEEVLVEERAAISREMYLGVLLHNRSGRAILMFCEQGGVDIEQVARETPEKLVKWTVPHIAEVREYQVRNELRKAGLRGDLLARVSSAGFRLCRAFSENDLTLAEINPLAVLENGEILAADSKVEMDNNALFRHPAFGSAKKDLTDPFEREAHDIGVTYVQMDGEIGIIASGAGLAMNTMDILSARGHAPANFLETGGGITAALIENAMGLLEKNPRVRGLIVNLYGGINPMIEAAKGIAAAREGSLKKLPVVVKLLGNHQEEAWSILESKGIPVVKNVHTEQAVDQLLQMLEAGK